MAEKNIIGSLLLDPDSISKINLEPGNVQSELDGRLYLEFLLRV